MHMPKLRQAASATLVLAALACSSAHAALAVLTQADFGAAKVTFSEVPQFTAFNGLTINGFTFSENVSNTTVEPGGPGETNNIAQPAALGAGNPAGLVITVDLPEMSSAFGFAYALLASGTVLDAVTVTLFDGLTNLGSLGFTGIPDPTFPGGFAGIGSTVAFNKATITFNAAAFSYDLDNFNSVAAQVPEPASLALVALALSLGAGARIRRRSSQRA